LIRSLVAASYRDLETIITVAPLDTFAEWVDISHSRRELFPNMVSFWIRESFVR